MEIFVPLQTPPTHPFLKFFVSFSLHFQRTRPTKISMGATPVSHPSHPKLHISIPFLTVYSHDIRNCAESRIRNPEKETAIGEKFLENREDFCFLKFAACVYMSMRPCGNFHKMYRGKKFSLDGRNFSI